MGELNLNALATETRNEKTMGLDEMSPLDIVTVMNEEDGKVIAAVRQVLPRIARVIEKTSQSLKNGGRIIYIGAGTSGRLGVLDAVECPPTFGVDDDVVIGLIAGGKDAFVKAREGAEDDPKLGEADLKAIGLKKEDTVIGLAASGRTPYVIGALEYANSLGSTTVAISCNPEAAISAVADIPVEVLTGPEVLTGSTRLKAGTAEKMVLNMISTASMIEIGKVYGNLMVDMRQTNKKLASRAENIVVQATGCTVAKAGEALAEADGEAKLAITKILLDTDLDTARACLARAGGRVRAALQASGCPQKRP
ncbi:N-acetylmuramic acid 6-phosphate etherase [Ruminococcaceae bacterium OttesenSCG-928-D13]|nr:N-acetylmuramic acid 6-phosphate etherase [Ruminococcaceae bacterium OttesenSCG-928-D13]